MITAQANLTNNLKVSHNTEEVKAFNTFANLTNNLKVSHNKMFGNTPEPDANLIKARERNCLKTGHFFY